MTDLLLVTYGLERYAGLETVNYGVGRCALVFLFGISSFVVNAEHSLVLGETCQLEFLHFLVGVGINHHFGPEGVINCF